MILEALPKRAKQSLAYSFASLFRTYLRYAPHGIGSEALWTRIMVPHLWWRVYDFTARTNFGSKIVGNTKDGIQRYLCFFGIWEPNLTTWIKQRLAPGDVFVDVGANIGYFTLLASKLVGKTGKVVAIEASPPTFSLLQRNLHLNGAENVRAINVAAADREQSMKLFKGPEEHIDWATVMKAWGDQHGCKPDCKVRAMPLTAILQPDEIRRARLIKIDVEGAEWQVVSGMASMLPSCRRDIEMAIEVTPVCLEAHGKTFQDLLAVFTPLGFHPYRIENDCSPGSYIRQGKWSRPRRLREPIVEQADIVLSRIDAESL